MILSSVLMMLAGLAFFLFGMNTMSGSLEKMAGGKLETTLKKVTSKPLMGFLLGAGITIAMQSSSAMTVMLVGLVNSGIMDFTQTIAAILGSNVGTTFTAWILSLMGVKGDGFSLIMLLSPDYLSPIAAFIGIVVFMLAKKSKHKQLGTILLGFAILMYGMEFMSDSVSAIKNMSGFERFIDILSNPFIALLVSTLFTGVIQSSAATVGIVQTLTLTGLINYEMAIPMVLGANIGTCVTALISSIGTNKNAKRVVVVHLYVNTVGSVITMILMTVLSPFIKGALLTVVTPFAVSIIHTVFNVSISIIMGLTYKLLVKFVMWIVPDKKDGKEKTVFLDERLLLTPGLAIDECKNLANEMAEYSRQAIEKAIYSIDNYSDELYEEIRELETLTDKYEDKLGTFLVRLSAKNLSGKESHIIGRMLHTIGDLERIGDHAENIATVAQELYEKKIEFSPNAKEEIKVITSALVEIVEITTKSFIHDNIETASLVEPLEQVIDALRAQIQARHILRVQKGDCTVELGFILSDLLNNYERVSDHCSNIAVYTVQLQFKKLDAHKYLRAIKTGDNEEFVSHLAEYEKKFVLSEEV
ncbi:MAG: Na/Pi cotransporter family protein [Acutalibacteraceae bacterium]|nr:Na/Pi cotransporter family protein [Acutalibacteraceae bacterium]